jgi:hypothetical protein
MNYKHKQRKTPTASVFYMCFKVRIGNVINLQYHAVKVQSIHELYLSFVYAGMNFI